MADQTNEIDITKLPVVYRVPGMDPVHVRQVEYGNDSVGSLTMDIYYPPEFAEGQRLPAVVFLLGYSDLGFQKMFGCNLNEMASYTSWGRLVAASGIIAVTYTTRDPEADADKLLEYIRYNAAVVGIDDKSLGIWSCSGNVPLALSVLVESRLRNHFKCAVLCYGFMLDLNEATAVAKAATKWRFANPSAGRSVEDLPQDLPLFIVRAGRDENPGLNQSIDDFITAALRLNLPITLVNHPSGPHAFDLFDDSKASRAIIKQVIEFLGRHLLNQPPDLSA